MSNLIPIDLANLAVENLNKEIAQLKSDINYLTIENNSNHARWLKALEDLEKYRWQPIETAPQDGTQVLVYYKRYVCNSGVFIAYWNGYKNCWWSFEEDYASVAIKYGNQPSHWMPLPKPPIQ